MQLWNTKDEAFIDLCDPIVPKLLQTAIDNYSNLRTKHDLQAFIEKMDSYYSSAFFQGIFDSNKLLQQFIQRLLYQISANIDHFRSLLLNLHPARSIDAILTGHKEISNIHTGDNVTQGIIDRRENSANTFKVGHVISIYTIPNPRSNDPNATAADLGTSREQQQGCKNIGPNIHTISADNSKNTKLLVVLFTPSAQDTNDHHPLVRCTKNVKLNSLPGFKGFRDLNFFLVMHLTPVVEIWTLSDVSGHAMLVPELIHLPVKTTTGSENPSEPTRVIFDFYTTILSQKCMTM
jgi:hypothetical protein